MPIQQLLRSTQALLHGTWKAYLTTWRICNVKLDFTIAMSGIFRYKTVETDWQHMTRIPRVNEKSQCHRDYRVSIIIDPWNSQLDVIFSKFVCKYAQVNPCTTLWFSYQYPHQGKRGGHNTVLTRQCTVDKVIRIITKSTTKVYIMIHLLPSPLELEPKERLRRRINVQNNINLWLWIPLEARKQ